MRILKQLGFLWVALFAVGAGVILFSMLNFRINLSGSMPIGIYQKRRLTTIHQGDIIAFCLPVSMAVIGQSRGYIGSGTCPGDTSSLVKTVIALPGNRLVLSSKFIQVNGINYLAPQQRTDHLGRPVIHWIKNRRYQNNKKIWVYGSRDPIHSWDSRYFGGITFNNIRGVYKPLWVF